MSVYKNKPSEEFLKKIYEKYFFNNKLIKHSICGKTHCGRNINVFQIGNTNKTVLLAAAFHGSEWLTSLVTIEFLKYICNFLEEKNIKNFLNKYSISIIPVVNADGVEIAINGYNSACEYKDLVKKIINKNLIDTKIWQANARGVDINHNFDAGWYKLKLLEIEKGITLPSYTRYGGQYPESENETKSIVNFCNQNHVLSALAIHSQGEEIFFDYDNIMPKESFKIAKNLSKISGYKLSEPEKIATGGGFKDWFIKKFKRPGFTIEIGKGKNPLPLSDFNTIFPNIKIMLLEFIFNIYKIY